MPDKLTDNEIVKAVKSYEEKILANGIKSLEPFEVREIVERQQEEINRLQGENEKKDKRLKEVLKGIENIKEQAYKEFPERLKAVFKGFDDKNEVILYSNLLTAIDCLLIGMVGDSNAE